MLKELLKTIRPKQWYKNLVLFAGIIFSHNLLHLGLILEALSSFAVFCMLSGAGYIINDIADRKADSKHQTKRLRPIASGKLKEGHALIFAIIIAAIALFWSYALSEGFLAISIMYMLLTIIYSTIFKKVIILDAIAIAVGFVIRAAAGALAINVYISPWLVVCTFLLSLLLVFAKRRQEKPAKSGYSKENLEYLLWITASLLILSYALYTFLRTNPIMMLTLPFAMYGVFKYLILLKSGAEYEIFLKDKSILIDIGLWIVTVVVLIYSFPA